MPPFQGSIRPVRPEDSLELRPILEYWLGPVAMETLTRILAESGELHVVAVEDGQVRGVMGLEFGTIDPPLLDRADRPGSIVSAYVHADHRGRGVGSALANHLEAVALAQGCTRLVVVSGSSSRDVGYGFWTSRYGPIAFEEPHAFGPGLEKVAWSVPLPVPE